MILPKKYWAKFKQESVSMLVIFVIHLWWIFNYPAYVKFGYPWDTIIAVAAIIGVTAIIIYLFLTAHENAWTRYVNRIEEPYRSNVERWHYIMKHIMVLIGFLVAWKFNIWGVSNVSYVLSYVYFLVLDILLYRAAHRAPSL